MVDTVATVGKLILPGSPGEMYPEGFASGGKCENPAHSPPSHQFSYQASAPSSGAIAAASGCLAFQGYNTFFELGSTVPAYTKYFYTGKRRGIANRFDYYEIWTRPAWSTVPTPWVTLPGTSPMEWPPQPQPLSVPRPLGRPNTRPRIRPRVQPRPRLVPAPRYSPKNWNGNRPDLLPRVARQPSVGTPRDRMDIGPSGGIKTGTNTRTRPPRRVDEKKLNPTSGVGRIFMMIINVGSEGAEFLDVLFSAAGIEGGGMQSRARRFFDGGYNDIDYTELFAGLAWNHIEDKLVGTLSRAANEKMRDALGQSSTMLGFGRS